MIYKNESTLCKHVRINRLTQRRLSKFDSSSNLLVTHFHAAQEEFEF